MVEQKNNVGFLWLYSLEKKIVALKVMKGPVFFNDAVFYAFFTFCNVSAISKV